MFAPENRNTFPFSISRSPDLVTKPVTPVALPAAPDTLGRVATVTTVAIATIATQASATMTASTLFLDPLGFHRFMSITPSCGYGTARVWTRYRIGYVHVPIYLRAEHRC